MNNSLKIIAVGALSMFVTSTAIAGGAIGVTVASGSIDASGYELLKSSNNRTTHSASEDVVIGSLFIGEFKAIVIVRVFGSDVAHSPV